MIIERWEAYLLASVYRYSLSFRDSQRLQAMRWRHFKSMTHHFVHTNRRLRWPSHWFWVSTHAITARPISIPFKALRLTKLFIFSGSLTTAFLVDKLGRKVLILVSLLGSACGLLTASFYHHVNQRGYDSSSYDWVPMIALSVTIFIASAGIEPLFYVCSVENLPAKVCCHVYTKTKWNCTKLVNRWRHWPDSLSLYLFLAFCFVRTGSNIWIGSHLFFG